MGRVAFGSGGLQGARGDANSAVVCDTVVVCNTATLTVLLAVATVASVSAGDSILRPPLPVASISSSGGCREDTLFFQVRLVPTETRGGLATACADRILLHGDDLWSQEFDLPDISVANASGVLLDLSPPSICCIVN